ncbi:MAG: anti-sigma factor domain-containing protein [Acidimicrobiia bacterium]
MRDLIAAWALDAVDDADRARVEALLAQDPHARAEADHWKETAAYLALADNDAREPVNTVVWDRIVAATGATPGVSAGEMADTLTTRAPAIVHQPRRWVWVGAAVAAAVLTLVMGIAIGNAQQNPTQKAAQWSYAERNGQTVTLRDNETPLARIAVLPDGTGVVHNDALPTLPEGKTYQLWAVVEEPATSVVISAGVLGREIADAPISFAGKPSRFVLTVEDAPGVAVSQQRATAAGTVA